MAFNPRVRRYLIIFLIAGWAISLSYFFLRSNKPSRHNQKTTRFYRDNRLLMGTFWEVVSPDKRAGEIVFSETKRIEGLLSKYIPESEISQLNRIGRLKVSPDTFYIIKRSKEFWQETAGAFDISVAPLVDIWGFSDQKHKVPSIDLIQDTLGLVGSDKIILHENDNVVEFKLSGMKIDLGAIAKGYALDCAAVRLKEKGISNCLINAGGQVYALGKGPKGNWRIVIQNPRKRQVSGIIELEKEESISTSGDYEQFFFDKGKRYSHIINPKTGYPATNDISSVTVIAGSALEADALSTAIFVLGKGKGEELSKRFPGTKIKIYQ
ncbi:MAG: FAD:protein FMN transferase [Candidatus Omnitrophica bacterium]|jgi:thiamine biosynthesis lipoprotein|nr:FAD:protein FMN transferase [Candidatus Omnitrophota bacterium]